MLKENVQEIFFLFFMLIVDLIYLLLCWFKMYFNIYRT